MNRIRIEGNEYPCYITLGAMLQYKRMTGHEVTDMDGAELSLLIILLFCCIQSCCRKEGITFPYKDEMEMADRMDQNDLIGWQSQTFKQDETDVDPKKKGSPSLSSTALQSGA